MNRIALGTKIPVGISVVSSVSTPDESGTVSLDMIVNCSNATIVQNIYQYMFTSSVSSPSVASFECGIHIWSVGRCSQGVVMCVDCQISCECMPSSDYAVGPCVQESWTNNACDLSGNSDYIKVVKFDLDDKALPVLIKNISPIASNMSIAVTLSLDQPGIVYCGAFADQLLSSVTVSASRIYSQRFSSIVGSSLTGDVNILGLTPSTIYNIYCTTKSDAGVVLPNNLIVESRVTLKTKCCKVVTLSVLSANVKEIVSVVSMLKVVFSAPPTSTLMLLLKADYYNDATNTEVYPFFKPEFRLTASDLMSSVIFGWKEGNLGGLYSLNVLLSGESANEYKIEYDMGNQIRSLTDLEPIPAPILLSVQFSNNGLTLLVNFDSPTDKALNSDIFACSLVFNFIDVTKSKCVWTSSRSVVVNLWSETKLDVSDFFTLLGEVIKAECSFQSSCKLNGYSTEDTVAIKRPESPILPSIQLIAPSNIGNCDDLTIDLTGSTGSGGRPFASIQFIVTGTSPNTTYIEDFLNSEYFMFPPTAISQYLLDPSNGYNFHIELCNFLGACGMQSFYVYVADGLFPVAVLRAPSTIKRAQALQITSSVVLASCDGTNMKKSYQYRWSVYDENGFELMDSKYKSASKDFKKFSLAARTLNILEYYTIYLYVTDPISYDVSVASSGVYVVSSDIVIVIDGGNDRSVQSGDTISVDASDSYDEDTLTDVGLTYSWLCEQSLPIYNDSCPFDLSDHSSSKIDVNVHWSVETGTQVKLTLTLSDSNRISQQVLTVMVVSPVAPRAQFYASDTKFNPRDKYKVEGKVSLTSDSTITWSIDGFTEQQTKQISLVETSQSFYITSIPSMFSIYFGLLPNVLLGRYLYVFRLHIFASNGYNSTYSISVSTNGAPQPGNFEVTPDHGIALHTSFAYLTSSWEDEDIPLTYDFGFLSSSNEKLAVVTQANSAITSFLLPSGSNSNGYSLTTYVTIYDSYNANASLYASVVVEDDESLSTDQLVNLTYQFFSSDDPGDIQQGISLLVSSANGVSCSSSPNCGEIHRSECVDVTDTCGPCISGYVGEEGSHNSPCVSTLRRRQLLMSLDSQCDEDADCGSEGFQCNSNQCVAATKSCANNCNGHGECVYMVKGTSETYLSTCTLVESDCYAVCNCWDGYNGFDCRYTDEEFETRKKLRGNLLEGLFLLSEYEYDTISATISRTSSLLEIVRYPEEISNSSLLILESLVNKTIEEYQSLSVSYELSVNMMEVINAMIKLNCTSRAMIEYYTHRLGSIIGNDMIYGENAVTSIQSDLRSSINAVLGSQNVSLTSPLTSAEIFFNKFPNSFHMESRNNSISTKYALYESNIVEIGDNNTYNSRVVTVTSSESDAYGICRLLSSNQDDTCNIIVVLQNLSPFKRHRNSTSHNITCVLGSPYVQVLSCPLGDYEYQCNGELEFVRVFCPEIEIKQKCVNIIPNAECKLVDFTYHNVTCSCLIDAYQISNDRRRLLANGNITLDSTTSFSVVAMTKTLYVTFVDNWKTADDLSAKDVLTNISVLIALLSLLVPLLFGLLLGYHKDSTDEKIFGKKEFLYKEPDVMKEKEKNDAVIDGNDDEAANKGVEDKGEYQNGEIASSENGIVTDIEQADVPTKSTNNLLEFVHTKLLDIIDQCFPLAFAYIPFTMKLIRAITNYHKWISVYFVYSSTFKRTIRVMSLANNLIIMLFMSA